MNVAITVDRTSSGKEHFEVLDGLRGTAAFLIVLFHVFNYPFGFRFFLSGGDSGIPDQDSIHSSVAQAG